MTRWRFIRVCSVVAGVSSISLAAWSSVTKNLPLTPTHLRCEYLVNPLGIDVEKPRLSWVLQSDVRGQKQTAYQVLVASAPEVLAKDQGDLWDSGKVQNAQPVHVEYGGKPLISRTRCYWKMQVWDKNDTPSGWSTPAQWSMGLLRKTDWQSHWIADAEATDRVKPKPGGPTQPYPCSVLRKQFLITSNVKHAMVYATARGLYELRINGRRVGDHLLAPEWTDYHKRNQVQAYDVTKLLQEGTNVLGVTLGEGWYSGRIGLAPPPGRNFYGSYPQLCLQLEMELDNGRQQVIGTDGTWRSTNEGPIRESDILDGEVYDARREMPGWDRPDFDQSQWQPVIATPLDDTKFVWQRNEPIRVVRELKPVKLTEPKPSVYVFDLGQNMVGWCRLNLQGPAGTEVTLRHAERLNPDGTIYTANLRSAAQSDLYILRGDGEEVYEPHFTYHGFRYVEVRGLTVTPEPTDLTGRVFHSSSPEVGRFACSNDLINRLMHNIAWVQRGNMHGSPTDCPQRDERLGWMGDIQAFSQTSIFNMDMAAFFSKWMQDVRDAQTEDGRYPDFAPHPFDPNKVFSGVPAWGDAGTVVPWRMYVNYADRRMLAEHFESARRWVDYVHKNNPNLLWLNRRHNDYGDWLNGDTVVLEGYPKGISAVPKEVFATAFFAHSTEILAKMAKVLDRSAEAAEYANLFQEIKAAFNRAFVTPDGRIKGNTQAGYALALRFNLLEDSLRLKALGHLLEAIKKYNNHLSTGIHSTHRMMLELSRNGQHDEACRLVNLRSVPSWGYTIEMGATTIWERWDGYVAGRGYQGPSMNSFNHWALGSVGEWIWRNIVGINPSEEYPGYEEFVVRPQPGKEITWAKGEYDSIRGRIASEWRIDGDHFTLILQVPPGTTATVYLPSSDPTATIENGKPIDQALGVQSIGSERSKAVYRVDSGRYFFMTPALNAHRLASPEE